MPIARTNLTYIGVAALCAVLASAPTYAGKLFDWQDLLLGALLLTVAALPTQRPADALPGVRLVQGLVGALALLLALSAAAGVYRYGSLVELVRLGGGLVALVLALRFARLGLAAPLWWALLGGALLASVWGIRNYVATIAMGGDPGWRIFGPFNNPNSLAGYLLVLLPLGIAMTARGLADQREDRPRWELIGGGACTLMIGGALLLTGSKAGILCALAGLVLFALLAPQPGSRAARQARLLALCAVVAVGVLAMALPPIRARIVTAFDAQAHSASFRWHTWVGSARMAAARPLLGYGPGSFEYAYPRYAPAGFTQMAHQSYLQWAAEGGVPAALLMLTLAGLAGRALLRRTAQSTGPERLLSAAAIAGLAGFILHNLVDYSWYVTATSVTLMALIGLGLGAPAPARSVTGPLWPACVGAALGVLVVAVPLAAQWHAAAAADLSGRGMYEAAVRRYERALAVCPSDADLWVQLSRVQEALAGRDPGRLAAAIDSRLRAAALRPTQSVNHRTLGLLYERSGDIPRAIEATRRAIELQPLYPRAYAQLARMLLATGDEEGAQSAYRELLTIYDTPYRHAQALEMLGEYSYVDGWLYLGRKALEAGHREQAWAMLGLAARETAAQLDELVATEQLLKVAGSWDPQARNRAIGTGYDLLRLLADSDDQLARLRAAALAAAMGDLERARRFTADNPLLNESASRPEGWEAEDTRMLSRLRQRLG